MAVKVKILTKDYEVSKDHIVDTPPLTGVPNYLGTRYSGRTINVTGVIEGVSHQEAVDYLATLATSVKNNAQLTLESGDEAENYIVSGYVDKLSYTLEPRSRFQRFSLALRRFD